MVQGGPDFIGLGPQRAASTWTYDCLREHPGVEFPLGKEVNFFNQDHIESADLEAYRRAFDGTAVTGEISPNYLWSELAPPRIAEHASSTRLFAVLRNPIDRAYSQYALDRRNGEVERPFVEVVGEKNEYIDRGFYGKQLKRYYNSVDNNRIAVFLFDDLEKDPGAFLESLLTYIGVTSDFRPPSFHRQANRGRYDRSTIRAILIGAIDLLRNWPPSRQIIDTLKSTQVGCFLANLVIGEKKDRLPPKVRETLWNRFESDVKELAKLIGRPGLPHRWAPDRRVGGDYGRD